MIPFVISSLFCGYLFNMVIVVILQRLLQGYIKESGIYCHCCKTVVRYVSVQIC